mgnify:CR=1 FL=1
MTRFQGDWNSVAELNTAFVLITKWPDSKGIETILYDPYLLPLQITKWPDSKGIET